MKRLRIILLALLVFGIGYGATSVVAQVGAALYKNPATGRSYPQQISAGYLATADGGVVNVMGSPAPTAVGQALRITTPGSNASASWTSDPDGGVYSGGGTTGYIPEWTGAHTLGNSTLHESGTYLYRQLSGYNRLILDSYATTGGTVLGLRRSHNITVGTLTTTLDADLLGQVFFYGVRSDGTQFASGAQILAAQVGTAGTYVPASLTLGGASSSGGFNSTQLVLHPDNSVTASGAFSAASYPTIGIAFKSTDSSVGITTNTNTTANVDLQVKGRVLSTASVHVSTDMTGGGALGTGTGVDIGIGTSIPRYVGSGAADPSQATCVPGPVMSFYYQSTHCDDGGCSYGLWWKSGSGDCQWTELASGSGGGAQTIALSSPANTIAVGSGGGLTTVEVNYGTTANTAAQGNDSRITGAEQAVNKGGVGGYCPLDGSALVPVANLPAVTQSVAGAMSGADKTKLDGIASGAMVDTYEVRAASGTTPGYLDAVCESTDSSITIGQTGNYLTFDANFGTSATQVCSGSTCAGKQPTLPGCKQGQELMGGTSTATGTATTTTTTLTCQNPPWQPAGSYEPAQAGKVGQVEVFGTVTSTGTATTTTTVKTAQDPPWQVAGNYEPLQPGCKNGQVWLGGTGTATGTSTTTSTTMNCQNPPWSTSTGLSWPSGTQGQALINGTTTTTGTTTGTSYTAQTLPVYTSMSLASQARIAAIAGTATASSTATQARPSDAVATIGSNTPTLGMVLFGASAATGTSTSTGTGLVFGYLSEGHVVGLASDLSSLTDAVAVKQASLGTSTRGAVLYNGSTSTSTSTTSSPVWGTPPTGISIDTNPATNVTAGPSTAGSNGKASDSGHIHHIGANTPTHGQWLVAGTDTTTSTNTTNAVKWATLPVPANQVRTFYSPSLATTVYANTNGTWKDVLSYTGAMAASQLVISSTLSIGGNWTTIARARIAIDGSQAGGQFIFSMQGIFNQYIALSPSIFWNIAAGTHTVSVQILCDGNNPCWVPGNDQVTGGAASLVVTEYTN